MIQILVVIFCVIAFHGLANEYRGQQREHIRLQGCYQHLQAKNKGGEQHG